MVAITTGADVMTSGSAALAFGVIVIAATLYNRTDPLYLRHRWRLRIGWFVGGAMTIGGTVAVTVGAVMAATGTTVR